MCSGWVAIHRKIKDNWLWQDKPFSKGQAWIDILLEANHIDNDFYLKGQLLKVKRGQSARSEVTLSKVWGWSRGKVRSFLKILEKEQMIVQQKNNVTSIITILNYDELQKIVQQKDIRKTSEKHQKNIRKTSDCTQTTMINNDNNDNNDNNKTKGNKLPSAKKLASFNRFRFLKEYFIEKYNMYPENLEQAIKDHMKIRDTKKSGKDQNSMQMYINSLEKLTGGQIIEMVDIIKNCTFRGWVGIFPINKQYNKNENQETYVQKTNRMMEEAFPEAEQANEVIL